MARNINAARTVAAINELAAAVRKGVRHSRVIVDEVALTVTVNDVTFRWLRDEDYSHWADFDQLEGWAVECRCEMEGHTLTGVDTTIQAKNFGRWADERRWR